MIDPILTQCVELYETTAGSSTDRMSVVFAFLSHELQRDAFPHSYKGNTEIFLDAVRLRERLLDAIRLHPETRTASYEPDLAKLTGKTLPNLQKASNL
jgi:hypothetical protein